MTTTLTDEQRTYLTDHTWAVLATGRSDGSPQVSMIGYVLDEEDRLIISIKSYTAKWKNALPTAARRRHGSRRPSQRHHLWHGRVASTPTHYAPS